MMSILNRIAVHKEFLEQQIFEPVLTEIDGASRLRTRKHAEEIRAALEQLQKQVQREFEAPLAGFTQAYQGTDGFVLVSETSYDPTSRTSVLSVML